MCRFEHEASLLAPIIAAVAEAFGLTLEELRSKDRLRSSVHARSVLYWVATRHTPLSAAQVAGALGWDHTTVMAGIRRIDACRAEPDVSQRLERIAESIRGFP